MTMLSPCFHFYCESNNMWLLEQFDVVLLLSVSYIENNVCVCV